MYRRERPQACLMLFSVPHTGETAAPGTTLCENYASRREQHQERDRAVTRVPTLKGKLQRTEHTTREKISEETKNPPLQTPAGLQTGSPDRTPTSPREADGEFFLLRFSSGKKSWRARRPIFSTCSAGGNTKEQRVRGYWQELLQIGGGGGWNSSNGSAVTLSPAARHAPLTTQERYQLQALTLQPPPSPRPLRGWRSLDRTGGPLSPSRCTVSHGSLTPRRSPRKARARPPRRTDDTVSPPPPPSGGGCRPRAQPRGSPRPRSSRSPAGSSPPEPRRGGTGARPGGGPLAPRHR